MVSRRGEAAAVVAAAAALAAVGVAVGVAAVGRVRERGLAYPI